MKIKLSPDVVNTATVYSLLDQRMVPHGKPVYLVVNDLVQRGLPRSEGQSEFEALLAFTREHFGVWSQEPAERSGSAQSILAVEHLKLLDEIATCQGPAVATALEGRLQRSLQDMFARGFGIKAQPIQASKRSMIPLEEVKPVNAYSALSQRMAAQGIQIHEHIREVVNQMRDQFARRTEPMSDVGYIRTAQAIAGNWPEPPKEQENQFQTVLRDFLTGVSKARGPGQAVVISTSLQETFARAVRRNVNELGLENHLKSPVLS